MLRISGEEGTRSGVTLEARRDLCLISWKSFREVLFGDLEFRLSAPGGLELLCGAGL